ncbi:Pre-mRNA-splicing factor cwf19 [Thecaphora frezii]
MPPTDEEPRSATAATASRHASERAPKESSHASASDRHSRHRKHREPPSHHHSSRRSRSRSRSRDRRDGSDAENADRKRRRKHRTDNDHRNSSSSPHHHHHHHHHHRSSSSSHQRDRHNHSHDHHPSRSDKHHKHSRSHSHRAHSPQSIRDDADSRTLPSPPRAAASPSSSRNPPDDHIPTSESLSLTSQQRPSRHPHPAPLPGHAVAETKLQRDDWMLFNPQADHGPFPALAGRDVRASRADLRADGVQNQDDGRIVTEDDYFASLGTERPKKQQPQRPDPEKLQISSRELNTQLIEGKTVDEYVEQPRERPQHGAPGHQWRMMKLRRVYEAAEEEGRPVEEVALERYASLEEFNEARAERQFLDDRERARGKGPSGRAAGVHDPGAAAKGTPIQNVTRRSFMFTDSPGPASGMGGAASSRPSSRQSFRRPGEASMPSTPLASTPAPTARGGSFRMSGYDTPGGRSDSSTKPSTPIPNVFAPVIPGKTGAGASALIDDSAATADGASSNAIRTAMQQSQAGDANTQPPLTANELNKLQAKAMRAELMGAPDAEELKEEYERQRLRAQNSGDWGKGFPSTASIGSAVRPVPPQDQQDRGSETEVQVLPTLDGQGRLYDVGTGASGDEASAGQQRAGGRRKNEKFETRDPKTGELLRYNQDDDTVTLADLVRQERFKGGSKDQKDLDAELASHIMHDARYEHDEDYIDENSERLARKKLKSDAMKRQFAIQDFAKTKKALDTCIYCWQDEGARPPRATVVSSGTRVYLALPEYESLTEGHCLIVPMQHHLSSLEAEDDAWDEIKNFMKCLMQMAAKRSESVVFYETVLSLKHQKHTVIEAVPVPNDVYPILPGVFKVRTVARGLVGQSFALPMPWVDWTDHLLHLLGSCRFRALFLLARLQESLMMVEEEWSTNAKVIDFAKKGFRRSMVPQLPYFMVQWDYRGDKGYGHVIEKADGAIADHDTGNAFDVDEGGRSGGDFPKWFAAEIIGNQLDLEPRRWRKPKRLDKAASAKRLERFREMWTPVDWTKMLDA